MCTILKLFVLVITLFSQLPFVSEFSYLLFARLDSDDSILLFLLLLLLLDVGISTLKLAVDF